MSFLGSHRASCNERPSGYPLWLLWPLWLSRWQLCMQNIFERNTDLCEIQTVWKIILWFKKKRLSRVCYLHFRTQVSIVENLSKYPWKYKNGKCCLECFPETAAMGDRLVEGDSKLMSSSTTDLLQKLNQSIKSVEQEIRVQQAVVHMTNLKVLENVFANPRTLDQGRLEHF